MATIYWDPTSGADINAGTFALPKATWAAASTTAGASGETRCIGGAAVDKGSATWTYGSTSVVFAVDAALSAGDWIKPQSYAYGTWYRVDSYDVGAKTATLGFAYHMETGSYTTHLAGGKHTLTATQDISTDGQVHTFGWTADGVQGGMNMLVQNGARINLNPDMQCIIDLRVGELALGYVSGVGSVSNALSLAAAKTTRIMGTLHVWAGTTYVSNAVVINENGACIAADAIRCVGGVPPVRIIAGRLHIGILTVDCTSVYSAIRGEGGAGFIGRANLFGGGSMTQGLLTWNNARIRVGHCMIRNLDTASPPGTTQRADLIEIGTLDKNQTYVPTGQIRIGGPVAEWRYGHGIYGVATKSTGRGGSGYGVKIDLGSNRFGWFELPLVRPVAASKSVVLKFYAVYTGTAADVPPAFVRVIEPNGLTVEDHAFTPARSANTPGGAPDGWTDATQHTITFAGTTAQAGSLQVGIYARDNVAGDAVLYIDDVTWVIS